MNKRKIVAGVLVVLVVGAIAVYLGLPRYAQMRAEREIDAAFEQARARGADASHGPLQFELAGKTITITDVFFKPTGDQAITLKVGRLVASNVDQADGRRFTASRIEISDGEFAAPDVMASGVAVSYRVPKLVIENYAGPMDFPPSPTSADPADAMRAGLAYFAALSAQSVAIPTLTAKLVATGNPPMGPFEYSYSDIALRDIRNGRIATASMERATFTAARTPDGGNLTGEVGRVSMRDIDTAPLLAALDPRGSNDDRYLPAYGQVSIGPMVMKGDKAGDVRIGGMSLDGLALRPSRFKLVELMKIRDLMPPAGQQPSAEQTRAFIERVSVLYEGMRIGNFEMRDMSTAMADAEFKLAAVRLKNLENGKFGEMALEGLDGRTPGNEPFRIGRMALKGLDIVNLMRGVAQFDPGQTASTDQLVAMLSYLEGIQLVDLDLRNPSSQRPARIGNFELSWGQFVGPLPSQAKLAAKVSMPITAGDSDPLLSQLAAAGMTNLSGSVDLAAAWNEATQTFAVAPAMIDLDKTGVVSAKLMVRNVPRGIFTVDPIRLVVAATGLEAGPVELTVRDAGGLDIAIGEFAKAQGVSPQEARQTIASLIATQGAPLAVANPDLQAVADAVTEFLNSRGATLTITVQPRARINLMQAVELAKGDPMTLLPQFRFNAVVNK